MAEIKITIDGNNFDDLDGFFDEMERLLTKDLSWRTGHNFDAFHDLLRGGFGVHDYGEAIDFTWINSEKSREDLGFEATKLYYEKLLKKCHPTNRETISQKITAAENREGKTLFDIIIEDINDKSSVYDHMLELV